MDELRGIMETIGDESLEAGMKIAGMALLRPSGQVMYQSANWDLTSQAAVVLGVVHGNTQFLLNEITFSVVDTGAAGIIATNQGGMGSMVMHPLDGGVLAAYVLPGADPTRALEFLADRIPRLRRLPPEADSI